MFRSDDDPYLQHARIGTRSCQPHHQPNRLLFDGHREVARVPAKEAVLLPTPTLLQGVTEAAPLEDASEGRVRREAVPEGKVDLKERPQSHIFRLHDRKHAPSVSNHAGTSAGTAASKCRS